MSLRPASIALDSQGGMFVVIDDSDAEQVVLIPCSWEHRRLISRMELRDYEEHWARLPTDRRAIPPESEALPQDPSVRQSK